MWEINNLSQLTSFFIAIGFGVGYCLIYDILRAIRKIKSTADITVFFQDIIYFLLITFMTFILLMALSNGEIRGYIIIGEIAGFVISFLTLSRITVKIFAIIFKLIKVAFEKIIELINLFFDKVEDFIAKRFKKTIELLKKTKKLCKNHLKKTG